MRPTTASHQTTDAHCVSSDRRPGHPCGSVRSCGCPSHVLPAARLTLVQLQGSWPAGSASRPAARSPKSGSRRPAPGGCQPRTGEVTRAFAAKRFLPAKDDPRPGGCPLRPSLWGLDRLSRPSNLRIWRTKDLRIWRRRSKNETFSCPSSSPSCPSWPRLSGYGRGHEQIRQRNGEVPHQERSRSASG